MGIRSGQRLPQGVGKEGSSQGSRNSTVSDCIMYGSCHRLLLMFQLKVLIRGGLSVSVVQS